MGCCIICGKIGIKGICDKCKSSNLSNMKEIKEWVRDNVPNYVDRLRDIRKELDCSLDIAFSELYWRESRKGENS